MATAQNDWRRLILDRFAAEPEADLGPHHILDAAGLYVVYAYEVLAVFEHLEDEGLLYQTGVGTWRQTTTKKP